MTAQPVAGRGTAPAKLTLVFGAGASWASPSERPLFRAVHRSLFDAVGVRIDAERRWLMAPEALLSRLADRGVDIDGQLRLMLAGGEPNALHYAAAAALGRGAAVWTTNFDELIESATTHLGVEYHRLVPGDEPSCSCGRGHLFKVHGTLSGQTVAARSEDVLQPLDEGWARRLRADLADAEVAVVGYAGADVDLRTALRGALAGSTAAEWFEIEAGGEALSQRFGDALTSGRLHVRIDDRPDLTFLAWAAARGLAEQTPAKVDQAARGALVDVVPPTAAVGADELLRGLIADDFGDFRQARQYYRRGALRGPDRRRSAAAVLSTGLIHGAIWRPAVSVALKAACATPLPRLLPHRQLILYLTWSGQTEAAWRAAQRVLARFGDGDPRLQLQAANLAKECSPADGARLAKAAQEAFIGRREARAAAWATLCRSLSLRWLGQLDDAETQAGALADGLDALAAPVWRAWGHFELGCVACLRGDAGGAVLQLREARDVFAAAGAENFVFDALCAELAAQRQLGGDEIDAVHQEARSMLDRGLRTSRFAREVLRIEEAELARAAGRLDDAERLYRQVVGSPTVAQDVLARLGRGEVQRACGQHPHFAQEALERSRELGFAYGTLHAAVTLGLAGVLDLEAAEAQIVSGGFPAPCRDDERGLLRFCLGPSPVLHALSFP